MAKIRIDRPTLGTDSVPSAATATRKVSPSTLSVTFYNRGEKIVEEHVELFKQLTTMADDSQTKIKPFGTAAVFTAIEYGLIGYLAEIRFLREEMEAVQEILDTPVEDLAVEHSVEKEAAEEHLEEMRNYSEKINEELVTTVENLADTASKIQL